MMATRINESNVSKDMMLAPCLIAANRIKATHISIHDGDLLDREMRTWIASFDFETALEVRKLVVVLS
jgi:hypothetical protein